MHILFVSPGNACRGPMAAALLSTMTVRATASSAGLRPEPDLDPLAAAVIKEYGVDVGAKWPERLTRDAIEMADIIVGIGPLEPSPIMLSGTAAIEWDIPEVSGQEIDAYRKTAKLLEAFLSLLLHDLEYYRRVQTQRRAAYDRFVATFRWN